MALYVDVYADSELIISKTANQDDWFYYWKFGELTFLFDAYVGVEVDGIDIEGLEGLPDKDGYHRWVFDHEGYRFELRLDMDDADWVSGAVLPVIDPLTDHKTAW